MSLCRHCRLAPAVESWTLTACAENRKVRKIPLCASCDIALNRLVLEFANVRGVDKIMAAYVPPSVRAAAEVEALSMTGRRR